MISNFLHALYHLDIDIFLINEKIRVKYKKEITNKETIEKIKILKPLILKRLKENEIAAEKGFLIHYYGDLYEYRYGLNSYLFIERLDDYKAIAWRANYRNDDSKPYNIKIIANNVSFHDAFQKATSFIDWMNKKRGGRYIS